MSAKETFQRVGLAQVCLNCGEVDEYFTYEDEDCPDCGERCWRRTSLYKCSQCGSVTPKPHHSSHREEYGMWLADASDEEYTEYLAKRIAQPVGPLDYD